MPLTWEKLESEYYRVSDSLKRRRQEARNAEIVKRYTKGETQHNLALAFNLCLRQIKRIVNGRRSYKKFDPKKIAIRDKEIYRRYMKGESAPDLAVYFGLDRCHVLKIVRNQIQERKHSNV